MSVVAWDGKSIAADKQATNTGLRFRATKIRRLASGEVLAWTGGQDSGAIVSKWYEDGADPEKWPDCQKDKEDWARLVVASAAGVVFFERTPVAIPIEDEFQAWGTGRDYALGAMARGATAREAVEIAMRFDTSCGLGIDEFSLEDGADVIQFRGAS
jgi:ATP-dependent protease HslVU (ClpYQ) peptidase subunit